MECNTNILISIFNTKKKFDKYQKQYIKNNYITLFNNLCCGGHFEFLKWLVFFLEVNDIDMHINKSHNTTFIKCCKYGYFDIVEFLYNLSKENGNTKININANYDEAFRLSCEYGHMKTTDFLYKLSKIDGHNKINISTCGNYSFRKSCEYGHKNIAEYLYNLSNTDNNTKININTYNNYAFKKSCENGHTETAIWLYNLSQKDNNIKINITAEYDNIFVTCCYKNYKEMAKWLYNISTIEEHKFKIDNNLFKQCCEKNCRNVVEWFCIVNSKYSFTIKNNYIVYKIKDIKETLKHICKKSFCKKKFGLYKMFRRADICKMHDTICPICLSEKKLYQIRLPCSHTLCASCFAQADDDYNKCHYRCDKPIDYDNIKLIKVIHQPNKNN